jgi:Cft2 family RNA processing exonuclease
LLSHCHIDHFNNKTIRKLAFERPTLRFGCCEWLVQPLLDCNVNRKNIDVYEPDSTYDYGMFTITPVKLTHDVPNCGYKIDFLGDKMLYATDTNSLNGIEAKDYDLYMIEANYEDAEISQRIQKKEEEGRYIYELRVLNNHLSKAKCDEFLRQNMNWNSECVFMHQHIESEI